MPEYVTIQGLKEFRKALRQIDKEAPKELRLALNTSADYVIGRIKPKIPARTGNARGSVKARSSGTEVRVAIGGRKAPYFPWLDFGGRTGRRRSVKREFIREGRYVYPTLRESRKGFEKLLEKAITDVAESAGVDVT